MSGKSETFSGGDLFGGGDVFDEIEHEAFSKDILRIEKVLDKKIKAAMKKKDCKSKKWRGF